MVNIPSPGRFAIHKCALSQMRPSAFAAKGRKDLDQARQLFQVLLEERPGDILLAYEAAEEMGARFLQRFRAGLGQLGKETKQTVLAHVGNA